MQRLFETGFRHPACLFIHLFSLKCRGSIERDGVELGMCTFLMKFQMMLHLFLTKSYSYPSASSPFASFFSLPFTFFIAVLSPPQLVSPPAEPYLIKQKCQKK